MAGVKSVSTRDEIAGIAASDRLLISVDDFDHVDAKGVRDINEFGEVETRLAGLEVDDERPGPVKSGSELGGREVLGLPNGCKNSPEDDELLFVVSGHWVRSQWGKIVASLRLAGSATRCSAALVLEHHSDGELP